MSFLSAMASVFRRRSTAIALSIVITVLALWVALRGVDWTRTVQALTSLNPWGILGALAVLTAGTVARAWRWHLFMRRSGSSFAAALESLLVSVFFNGLLPLRSGEAMRVAYFARRTGAPVMATTTGLVIERILDLATISALGAGAVIATVGDRFEGLPLPPRLLGGLAVAACASLLVGGYVLARLRARRGPADLTGKGRLRRWFEQALDGLSSLESAPGALLLIAVSFAMWGLTSLASVIIFNSSGYPISPAAGMVILMAIAFAIALPSSPGFIGTYHLGFIAGATLVGLPQEAAAAAAIVTHLLAQVPFVLAGGYILATGGRRLLQAPVSAPDGASALDSNPESSK